MMKMKKIGSLDRDVFVYVLERSGHQQGPFVSIDHLGLSFIGPRRDDPGEDRADEDHTCQQHENVGDLETGTGNGHTELLGKF